MNGRDLIDEVEFCAADRSPEDLVSALGMKPDTIARALARNGRPDLARPFWRLALRERAERSRESS